MTCVAVAVLARALVRGRFSELRQRLGLGQGSDQPHLWLHGASNGELASARPVILGLLDARPDLRLLITSNSLTGQSLAAGLDHDRITAVLAPLDLGWVSRAFLRRWSVTGHITLESEFWPNRLRAVAASGKPCMAIGARLSERSARGWAKLPEVTRGSLSTLSLLSPQDAASGPRFVSLGLPQDALAEVFDLKSLYTPKSSIPGEHPLPSGYDRLNTWLAASTHDGEDETILDAHTLARRTDPDLRLILAPRHPARADAVAKLVAEKGFTLTRRSRPMPEAEVFLADTLGEMDLWYANAGRVLVGGSLVDKGGHTPYEPATHSCALLHGPFVGNFTSAYERLAEADAAVSVTSAQDIATALTQLAPAAQQTKAGDLARATLKPATDAEWLVAALLARIST